jgi:xanthine dehydrogenase accessory factor
VDPTSAERAAKLAAEGVPFVHATVVRAQAPAPARAGDDAFVLADGRIEGFVGGQCVEASLRVAALEALADGAAVLLRVLPDGAPAFPDAPGARVVSNPCLSGGALEIFLEPQLPAPVVAVGGETPIAAAVVRLSSALGLAADSMPTLAGAPLHGAQAAVVASHGHDEPASIQAALDAGVRYVGLVASRRRGEAVLDAMGLSEGDRSRVHTPAGLDIGAKTPAEIGLSIVAQIVQVLRAPVAEGHGEGRATSLPTPQTVVDPICGMAVSVGPHTPHRVVDGVERWFCSPACRDASVA